MASVRGTAELKNIDGSGSRVINDQVEAAVFFEEPPGKLIEPNLGKVKFDDSAKLVFLKK